MSHCQSIIFSHFREAAGWIDQKRTIPINTTNYQDCQVHNSHLSDAVSALEGSLLNLLDLVPAHVQGLQVGEPVEEAEGGDLADLVVGKHEVGGGGRDPGGNVEQVGVRTVDFASIAPENISR